jgi:hypothetical protein
MNHLDNIKKLFSKNFVENPLIESFDAGKLHLPTGQLLACDPLLTNDMKPFTVNFPKGDHHVIVHQEKDSHGIAYVEVVFSDEVCQSWQMAVTEGQNLKDLKKGEKYNIVSKNYPLKPEEIKKKYKLNDGGNHYLIFTQSVYGKEILRSQ